MLVNILYAVMEEDMNGLYGGKCTFVVFFCIIVATITGKANSLLILMHRHTLQLRRIVTLKLQHTVQCWHPTACFPLHV